MALNRRGFLGLLATVAAGATLDPERLLWVPGAKLISIPGRDRYMADVMREMERIIAAGMGISLVSYLNRKAAFGLSDEDWIGGKCGTFAAKEPGVDAFVQELFPGRILSHGQTHSSET